MSNFLPPEEKNSSEIAGKASRIAGKTDKPDDARQKEPCNSRPDQGSQQGKCDNATEQKENHFFVLCQTALLNKIPNHFIHLTSLPFYLYCKKEV